MDHVLVIDDSSYVRRLISLTLTNAGFSVVTAETREEALNLLRGETPQLVILDLMMRGMTAREFMRRIHEEGYANPVLVLSANLESGSLLGADDTMTKPFDPEDLIARVRLLCGTPALPEHEREPIAHEATTTSVARRLDALVSKKP